MGPAPRHRADGSPFACCTRTYADAIHHHGQRAGGATDGLGHAAPKLTYVACRAMVVSSPVYLGGKESSLACERPCEAAIQRCIENGGRFW
jgi:hypothetical protein